MSHYDEKQKRSLIVFAIIFFFLSLGVVIVGAVSYGNYRQDFRNQAERQLSVIAELKMNELINWRKERLIDTELLLHNLAFSGLVGVYLENPNDAETKSQLAEWLAHYQAYDQYSRVRLLDAAGVERFSMPSPSDPSDEHLKQDVVDCLKSGEAAFLDFHRDQSANGKIHLSILVPIYEDRNNRHPLGVIFIRIDPEVYLYPYLEEWPLPSETAETLLVRREGEDVLFLNNLRFKQDAALTLRYPLTNTEIPSVRAALGETGVVEGTDYRGHQVIADIRAVPDSPWFLVSKMDTSEVYAPLRTRLQQTIAMVIMTIVASGAALLTIWRQQRILFYRSQVESAVALHDSESRYRIVVSNAPLVTFVTDNAGIFLLSDGMGLAKLGLQPGQVVGLSVFDVYRDYPSVVNAMKKALAGESQRNEVEVQGIVFDVFYSPVMDESGKVVKVIGVSNDITDRVLAENQIRQLNLDLEKRVIERTAQLETTNKELEAFSYSVSHDLRAPLRGIDGWGQALSEDYADQLDEQGQQYIKRVRSETQRMGQLIDDMLQLSRLTRTEMNKHKVDLSALAHSIVERLKQGEPQRQVEFEIQAGLIAEGDSHLLEAVLANLLGNAFKFTGKTPTARIEFGETESQGQRVFFVRDNGVGFDMAYSQKLFGAFQRMHKVSEFPGTGVGLASVQRVIHRHGGRVWAEAEVGHGATFYFTLG